MGFMPCDAPELGRGAQTRGRYHRGENGKSVDVGQALDTHVRVSVSISASHPGRLDDSWRDL